MSLLQTLFAASSTACLLREFNRSGAPPQPAAVPATPAAPQSTRTPARQGKKQSRLGLIG